MLPRSRRRTIVAQNKCCEKFCEKIIKLIGIVSGLWFGEWCRYVACMVGREQRIENNRTNYYVITIFNGHYVIGFSSGTRINK